MYNMVSSGLRYRTSMLIRVLALLRHGVLGPEPEFQDLQEAIDRNMEKWFTVEGDFWPEMKDKEAASYLLPLAEALYGAASGLYSLAVPEQVQSAMYRIVEYLQDQLPLEQGESEVEDNTETSESPYPWESGDDYLSTDTRDCGSDYVPPECRS